MLPSGMVAWTFRLAIASPNIRANLPENQVNILISGQNDMSINGLTETE
jgi:hypothetical protein